MSCKHRKKRYSVAFATIDKTPYARDEWFRIGIAGQDFALFNDAMRWADESAERQLLAHVSATLGRDPKRGELNSARKKLVDRPTGLIVMVKLPNFTTLYKVCPREGA